MKDKSFWEQEPDSEPRKEPTYPECVGLKIRSKGKGRGLGIGKGKGPIGRMKE